MRKLNVILLAILVVQVILGVIVYTRPDTAQAEQNSHWVTMDPATLSSITITDNKGTQLLLEHGDEGWRVPGKHDFPADAQQVKSLVTRLDSVRPDLPVAVSDSAQQRFHVAPNQFERHAVFKTDTGVAADIYVGKSAGAGRLYARLADSNAIQDIRLPLWRISVDAGNWLDKGTLALDLDAQKRIVLPHVALVRQHDSWVVQNLDKQRISDHAHIKSLLYRLQHLQWNTLVGPKKTVKLSEQATFKMTVKSKDGDKLVYRFYKIADDNAPNADSKQADKAPTWRVTRSDRDYVVTLSNEHVEDLRQADAKSLSLAKPDKTDKPGQADTTDSVAQGSKS